MPLIIITGIPCSGKTTRAEQLKTHYEKNNKSVIVLRELDAIKNAGFEKDSFYLDSQKEKHIRSLLKSEVQRNIVSGAVVILDALNYIKGYRYELYCAAKSSRCTQCTVHCEINTEHAFQFNETRLDEKYSRNTFDALVMRYEAPDSRNRWDSPLFVVFPEDSIDFSGIDQCLFEKKPPPPNMSTQNVPLSSTNFLYDLDRITQNIDQTILSALKIGLSEDVSVPEAGLSINCTAVTAPKLSRLRRQFITYSKMHPADLEKIPVLYVQYLKTQMNV